MEKIYLNYLTLLILSTFLKCSQYTSVRNGLAFWKRDLTTKILRFANTCTICGEFNKQKNIWIITFEMYYLWNICKRANDDCMIQSTRS